ncbi:MAG TPA: dihydropteroate synthase [Gemmatimonadales bacterium]|nr:dihydropteroate synthase [Gemmatimonadales bacterium]
MKLVPLAGRPEEAVRDALLSHGWEGELCRTTAAGLESLAYRITDLGEAAREALVATSGRLGLDVVTGEDWALLAGPRARLAALARPWTAPEPLGELAAALGTALPADEPALWQTARGPIALDRPVLIGILNVTPDSFSDGGRYTGLDAALAQAERLLRDGAAILDVGGESTRPGATPVPVEEELARVVPVIEAIVKRFSLSAQSVQSVGPLVCVDTTKSSVARAALDTGAAIVNDVSALRLDPGLGAVCAERGAGVVLMHSRGTVATMASLEHAVFPDGVLAGVHAELAEATARAAAAGVAAERIVLDPGLGFGKTPEQNLELLRGLGALRALGRPLMVGPSRKRFLGELTGRPVEERDQATAASCALAWVAGARLFRVHEPAPARDALAVARAVRPR